MDTIVQHIEEHLALYAVAVVFGVPVLYLFRKQTLVVIYHGLEYFIYCGAFHYLFGGAIRLASWFRAETSFKNADGSFAKEYVPYTTPLNLHFWEKELYNPQWFIYVEAAAAVLLLYVVTCIRPTRFKRNFHRVGKERPQKTKKTTSVGKPGLTSRMRSDAQRARLQKNRGNR